MFRPLSPAASEGSSCSDGLGPTHKGLGPPAQPALPDRFHVDVHLSKAQYVIRFTATSGQTFSEATFEEINEVVTRYLNLKGHHHTSLKLQKGDALPLKPESFSQAIQRVQETAQNTLHLNIDPLMPDTAASSLRQYLLPSMKSRCGSDPLLKEELLREMDKDYSQN